jgi:hypothetical protein
MLISIYTPRTVPLQGVQDGLASWRGEVTYQTMRRIIGGKLPRLGMKAKLASTNSHEASHQPKWRQAFRTIQSLRNFNFSKCTYWPSEAFVGAVVEIYRLSKLQRERVCGFNQALEPTNPCLLY